MKLVLSWLLVGCLVLSSGFATASSAQDFLKGRQAELVKHAKADDKPKLTETFDKLLDYDALAKSSMGAEWEKLSDGDKKTFTDLLKTLIKNSYTKNIRDTLDYEVTFVGQSAVPGEGELVQTVAKPKDTHKEPIRIDYKVRAAGDKWLVIDIITEDVSMVSSYRSQFQKVMKKSGFSGLIELMQKKAKAK